MAWAMGSSRSVIAFMSLPLPAPSSNFAAVSGGPRCSSVAVFHIVIGCVSRAGASRQRQRDDEQHDKSEGGCHSSVAQRHAVLARLGAADQHAALAIDPDRLAAA